MSDATIEAAVDAVIDDLCQRRPYKHDWQAMPADVEREIRATWIGLVAEAVRGGTAHAVAAERVRWRTILRAWADEMRPDAMATAWAPHHPFAPDAEWCRQRRHAHHVLLDILDREARGRRTRTRKAGR